MAAGLAFHMSANGYLLLGIPITVIFQRYVRRAPLRAMWVREAPSFHTGIASMAVAMFLMLAPLIDLVNFGRSPSEWTMGGRLLAAWSLGCSLRHGEFRPRDFPRTSDLPGHRRRGRHCQYGDRGFRFGCGPSARWFDI